MERCRITQEDVCKIIDFCECNWIEELGKKGPGIFVSSHEILGVLTEEVREFEEAVKSNNLDNIKKELRDIMVVALHGIASIDTGKLDWPKEGVK